MRASLPFVWHIVLTVVSILMFIIHVIFPKHIYKHDVYRRYYLYKIFPEYKIYFEFYTWVGAILFIIAFALLISLYGRCL
jgi:hypothetical protein